MTARNRVVREPYATWCGRTPVEIIHGLLPNSGFRQDFVRIQSGVAGSRRAGPEGVRCGILPDAREVSPDAAGLHLLQEPVPS